MLQALEARLTHRQALVLMVAITLMWSIAGVVSRQLESAKGFEVTFWRSFFTVISLLVLLPLMQGIGALAQIHWKSRALWLSGLCWSVMFTAFMMALTLTTVANVLITMSIGPLCTALASRIFIGQHIAQRTWWAIAVAGVGIAYMYWHQLADGANLVGTLVALCVPVAAAVQWTLTQALQNKAKARQAGDTETVDLVPAVLIGAVISSLVTLPLAFPFVASASDVAWLGLLGLVQLAIPCALSVVCARVLKGPEVSLLALLEVIFGIAWAWAFAGESPGERALVGGALVLGALVANGYVGLRKPA